MLHKILILFVVFIITLSSCVSKKKYLEMEAGRLKSEKLSQQLDEENSEKAARIEALIADFEAMKNELLESNSIKDQYIDSLSGQIFTLAENLNKQRESLQETNFNLDFEQQRLNNALKEKDKIIAGLQKESNNLEKEITMKSSELEQQNFKLSRMNDDVTVMEGKLQTSNKKITDMQAELQKVKDETTKLQEQIKEKDNTITRLENNVKLLKKELLK